MKVRSRNRLITPELIVAAIWDVVFWSVVLALSFALISYAKADCISITKVAPHRLVSDRGRGQLFEGESAMGLYHSVSTNGNERGKTFGKWVQLGDEFILPTDADNRRAYCVVQCKCGEVKVILKQTLRRKASTRCALCGNQERRDRNTKHGMYNLPEYAVWVSMVQRCTNAKSKSYRLYGGRGIRVCDRWKHSFADFISDVGRRPRGRWLLDRIDNNGNYEPGNVRWASDAQSMRNTRRNNVVTYHGCAYVLTDLACKLGMKPITLYTRLIRGWSIEDACNIPVRKRSNG